jgi:hypothetical protein
MLKSKKAKKDVPTETVYVGKRGTEGRAIWDKFADNCLVRGLKVSPSILQLLAAENKRISGLGEAEIQQVVSMESLKERRLQLKKIELRLFKLLAPDPKDTRAPLGILCNFFRINHELTKNFEDTFNKVLSYDYTGKEPFGASQLENFIEYMEAVRERRGIESKLRELRRKDRQKK